MTEPCDHLLGYLHGYEPTWIRVTEKWSLLKRTAETANYCNMVTNGRTDITAKDYTDKRKNMATWFRFCPECGVKLPKP